MYNLPQPRKTKKSSSGYKPSVCLLPTSAVKSTTTSLAKNVPSGPIIAAPARSPQISIQPKNTLNAPLLQKPATTPILSPLLPVKDARPSQSQPSVNAAIPSQPSITVLQFCQVQAQITRSSRELIDHTRNRRQRMQALFSQDTLSDQEGFEDSADDNNDTAHSADNLSNMTPQTIPPTLSPIAISSQRHGGSPEKRRKLPVSEMAVPTDQLDRDHHSNNENSNNSCSPSPPRKRRQIDASDNEKDEEVVRKGEGKKPDRKRNSEKKQETTKEKPIIHKATPNFVRLDLRSGKYKAKRKRGLAGLKRTANGKHILSVIRGQRWKSFSTWKKDQEAKNQDGLYVEVLDEKETGRAVRARGDAVDGSGTEEELAGLNRLEEQFEPKLPVEIVAKIDPFAETKAKLLAGDNSQAKVLLKNIFGFDSFLPLQQEVITRICHGESTLAILPTGGGKSLCYQLPAFAFPGLTLVVSPLISLMQDQVQGLPSFLPGALWSSHQSQDEVCALMTALRKQKLKLLFVSPEKLVSPSFARFITSLPPPGVSFACVDEAHCVSQWAHNFRPAYLHLRPVLRKCRVRCVLAITATATTRVTQAVCKSLDIDCSGGVIRASPRRPNLTLSVSTHTERDKDRALRELLSDSRFRNQRTKTTRTPKAKNASNGGMSVIVYVTHQRKADEVAAMLKSHRIVAESYHAGKAAHRRKFLQEKFMTNKLEVMVATVAFGMGLDKSDVRGVVHYNVPRTFESYVQEIGRAGRDGLPAWCHTLYSEQDVHSLRNLAELDGATLEKSIVVNMLERVFPQRNGNSVPIKRRVGDHVALVLSDLEVELSVKAAVIGTVLSACEGAPEPLLEVVSCLHNKCVLGFHRTDPAVLAQSSEVVAHIIEQAGTSRSGIHRLNLDEVATKLRISVGDVQAQLVRLKAQGDISIEWQEWAYCVRVLHVPSAVELDDAAEEVTAALQAVASAQLCKLDIVSEALKAATSHGLPELPIPTNNRSKATKTERKDPETQLSTAADVEGLMGDEYDEDEDVQGGLVPHPDSSHLSTSDAKPSFDTNSSEATVSVESSPLNAKSSVPAEVDPKSLSSSNSNPSLSLTTAISDESSLDLTSVIDGYFKADNEQEFLNWLYKAQGKTPPTSSAASKARKRATIRSATNTKIGSNAVDSDEDARANVNNNDAASDGEYGDAEPVPQGKSDDVVLVDASPHASDEELI